MGKVLHFNMACPDNRGNSAGLQPATECSKHPRQTQHGLLSNRKNAHLPLLHLRRHLSRSLTQGRQQEEIHKHVMLQSGFLDINTTCESPAGPKTWAAARGQLTESTQRAPPRHLQLNKPSSLGSQPLPGHREPAQHQIRPFSSGFPSFGGVWLVLTWKIPVMPVWRKVLCKNFVDVMGGYKSHKHQPGQGLRAGSDQPQGFGQGVPMRWEAKQGPSFDTSTKSTTSCA